MRGGFESIYLGVQKPIGLLRFAKVIPARILTRFSDLIVGLVALAHGCNVFPYHYVINIIASDFETEDG
jgi:hypothetical protein